MLWLGLLLIRLRNNYKLHIMENVKPHELRIGNMVTKVETGEVCEIFALGIKLQFDAISSRRPYSEIPLTEKWLKLSGFKKTNILGISYRLEDILLETEDLRNWYWQYKIANSQVKRFVQLTSVHQLQNLYFGLTGQELTFEKENILT